MLKLALDAQIPIVTVSSDDIVNLELVLHSIAKRKPTIFHKATKQIGPWLFYTFDEDLATVENYKRFEQAGNTLVVVNSLNKVQTAFECGELQVPEELVYGLLDEYLSSEDIPVVQQVLKGLTLQRCSHIVKLTIARTGNLDPKEVRKTRSMLGETVQGLIPVEPSFDFYSFPPKLASWLQLNQPYFLDEGTHPKLMPRGVMLEGSPGVGKSMAAKAIAKYMGVPLYRLDVASTLNRYVGESEGRVARSLQLLEQEAPCVLLLDELEKVFNSSNDEGVTSRILAQLLWWLADHTSRVLTVMTTNDLTKIPPELYRTGRVDMVMRIPRMGVSEAKQFAQLVFKSVTDKPAALSQSKALFDALVASGQDDFSHAEVAEVVYTTLKTETKI